MPAILWTPALDRRIAAMRADDVTWDQIAAALGISSTAIRARAAETAAVGATYVDAADRARREQARVTLDALENRFASGLVSRADGAPAEAWRLYHERKMAPAASAERLGVDRAEFWDLVAAQAKRLADMTVAVSMESRAVPAPLTVEPPNSIQRARRAFLARQAANHV